MGKKIGLFFGVVVLSFLLWYFFLKPHDYVVRFEVKALPGTINQTLKFWGNQLEDNEFLEQNDLLNIENRIKFNDSTYTYHWKIESQNDSISKVKVYVTDDEHSLANRLAIPFSETDFEKRTKRTVEEFTKALKDHLLSFRVTVTGKDEISSKYCACFSLKGTQREKARGMMEYYSLLSNIMAQKKVVLDGTPLLKVTKWNMQKDSISYDFCFPVIKSDSLPKTEGLSYIQIEKQTAIRAVYHGNYITSDRAWYALVDYAKKNNIAIDQKPLEIFHTNPNMGGDELQWEAEVFMPVQE
ncbi:effector-binding domain-containing protein [Pricia antarctica]|uniref:Effector-binding domain-containing protein n=1 Tax=Pricia antarctica TaxID=641691 RepID=A0A1G6VVP3_9FLAO|nr:GyrI-like domain-containing protein [Pricia antarctica]SDD57493.1 effector-binding domain-containing protein [Pricia antarctica]